MWEPPALCLPFIAKKDGSRTSSIIQKNLEKNIISKQHVSLTYDFTHDTVDLKFLKDPTWTEVLTETEMLCGVIESTRDR